MFPKWIAYTSNEAWFSRKVIPSGLSGTKEQNH